MRVLVVTTAGTGHILPTLPVADAFRRAGHDVVWATAADSHAVVDAHGYATRTVGIGLAERATRFAEDHGHTFELPPADRRPAMFSGLFAHIAAPVAADALGPVLDELEPDLVVHEVAELASAPLTADRGIDRVTVAFSGEVPVPVRRAAAKAVAPVWERVGRPVPDDLGLYSGTYLHPFAPSLGQRPVTGAVRDVAPAGTPAPGPTPGLPDGLAGDRPLVYVTFGTEAGRRPPWGALLEGLDRLDVDVLVTSGATPPETVAEAAPGPSERVRIERYVPQHAVLGRAAVVVSHGGAGTMIAAGATGLPQLVMPLGADQFDNARAFATAGSTEVVTPEITASDVTERVDALLRAGPHRDAAGRLASEFAAMASADEAIGHLTAR